MLGSVLATASLGSGFAGIAVCTLASLILGAVVAFVSMYRNVYTQNFVFTIALLPAMVQAVIMLVNGNLGAGVAVAGAFSLVRFRSAPGSAREIASIFFAMAIGLATGMGYVAYAALFTAVLSAVMVLYTLLRFGERDAQVKSLRVTVPEDVDYTSLFDDLFAQYTQSAALERVRTTNLGSLFELQYTVTLRPGANEKEMLDEIRKRNANLNITCGRVQAVRDEL